MTEFALTDHERHLLLTLHGHLGEVVASPEYGIAHLAEGYHSGGGRGFDYAFTKTKIVATWHEWLEAAWRDDGTPWRWRSGELLRETTISYQRLRAWVESLPADVRAQALIWWRTYPEWTRDLAALDGLVIDLLRPPAEPEPTDLLQLLEMTNA